MNSWRELRADLDVDEEAVAGHRTRMLSEVRAYRLAELRHSQGLLQEDIAEAMGVVQSRVSQIENGDLGVAEIPTVRKYVEALGGHLEIVADFGDQKLRVC